MSERLVGVVEAVEAVGDDNGALAARTARVKAVGSGESTWGEHDFGPHDLCRLGKTWRGIGIKSHAYRQGFYHLMSGLDVSVEGACAYFRQLQDAVEPVAWLSMTAGQWAIEEAEFCFYAAFSQVDVRLRVRVPGQVTQLVVGPDGTTMGCPEDLWLEARLCSILRSLELMRLGPAQVLRGGNVSACLRVWDPLPVRGGIAAEQEFLTLAARFFPRCADGHLPGRWATASASAMSDTLTAYFCDAARYADGSAFFTSFGQDDLDGLIGRATFLARAGDEVGAREMLGRALAEARRSATDEQIAKVAASMQESDQLTDQNKEGLRLRMVEYAGGRLAVCLREWARYHLRHENLHKALGCAVWSIENGGGGDIEAWLLLARVLLDGEEYELAMLALNNAPIPHGFAEDEPAGLASTIGMDPVSCSVRTTKPPAGEEHLIMSELRTITSERESARRMGKPTLGVLTAPQLSGTKRRAYAVLVEMLHALGWEPLLELRAEVFLVDGAPSSESELETDPEADAGSNADSGVEQGQDEEDHEATNDAVPESTHDAETAVSRSDDEDYESSGACSSDGSDGDDERSDHESANDREQATKRRSRQRQDHGQHHRAGAASNQNERTPSRLDDISSRMDRYYCQHAIEPDLSQFYSPAAVCTTASGSDFEEDGHVDENSRADADSDAEGPALSSVEQLEELLAEHAPQNKVSGALPSRGRRQYSSPWLEQLFRCLHQDLVALTEWHATAKLTQSAQVVVDDPENVGSEDSLSNSSALSAQRNAYYSTGEHSPEDAKEQSLGLDGQVLRERTRSRPTVDWVRLGELAERLDTLDDAVQAYTHASKAVPTSYIALRRLLLLYTSCGRLAKALIAADDLCKYLGEQKPTAVVVACVAQLLDEHGPDELRLVIDEEVGQLHPAVGSAIVEAVARVSGVDPNNRPVSSDEEEVDDEEGESEDEDEDAGDKMRRLGSEIEPSEGEVSFV